MPDTDGYPTDEELSRVRQWPEDDPAGWLAYIKSIWHWPDWGWTQEGDLHHVSTGGWSGNEAIIAEMQHATWLWTRTWESTRRGGHYVFTLHR